MTEISSKSFKSTLGTSAIVRPSSPGIETSQLDSHELHDPSYALQVRIELAVAALTAFVQADLIKTLDPSILEPLQASIQSIMQLHLFQGSDTSALIKPHLQQIEKFSLLLKMFTQLAPEAVGLSKGNQGEPALWNEGEILRGIAKNWRFWYEVLDNAQTLNNELKGLHNRQPTRQKE